MIGPNGDVNLFKGELQGGYNSLIWVLALTKGNILTIKIQNYNKKKFKENIFMCIKRSVH